MPKKGKLSVEEQGRIEERRRQILEAAALVFSRHGYHRASTHEIADVAGVAQGTIYNYYKSKRDLLIALIQQIITESMPDVPAPEELKSPRDWLIHVLSDRLQMAYRNRDLIMAVAPELFSDEALQREYFRQVATPIMTWFLPLVRHTLRDLPLREFDVRIVFPAIVGAVMGAVVANQRADWMQGEGLEHDQLVSEIVDFILKGITA